MARLLAAIAATLIASGLIAAVWFIGWGVHSCDDWGGNPRCEQMERHSDVFLASLAAVAVGVGLALVAVAITQRTSHNRNIGSPRG